YCKHNNKSCFGIIIKDANGRVLFSKSSLYGNIPSPFAVEALACSQATEMELHVELTMVEIEGGALSVISKAANKRNLKTFKQCRIIFRYCKPLVQIDGTFMYERYEYWLLLVVAKDGDTKYRSQLNDMKASRTIHTI
ncbi:hypothetical protein Gorai_002811, partial [Gossypium raimondii]|nr:hypothetical protein [Gossypium raimondii]